MKSPEAIIDLLALKNNFDELASWGRDRSLPLMPVLKANAYGHGAIQVALYLESIKNTSQMPYICVARWSEALELRNAGVEREILILSQYSVEELEAEIPEGLTLLVGGIQDLSLLERLDPQQRAKLCGVHIDIDTGMGRLGFKTKDFSFLLDVVSRVEKMDIKVTGVCTHLARAEDDPSLYTQKQLQQFEALIHNLKLNWPQKNMFPKWIHLANSFGCLWLPQASFLTAARPGVLLWGVPADSLSVKKIETRFSKLKLIPVMRLKAPLREVFIAEAGNGLSYGHRFIPEEEKCVGVVSLGYADGLSRSLSRSNKDKSLLNFWVQGHPCPILGTITMDMTLIDLSEHPDRDALRSQVACAETIWADWICEEQGVAQIAEALETISYEVLCGVGLRVQRHYNQKSHDHSAS